MTAALALLFLLASAPAVAPDAYVPGLCGYPGEHRCAPADTAHAHEVRRAFTALFALCDPSDAFAMEPHVRAQSRLHGVPVALLVAVARVESQCRAGLVSVKGAVGRWQILPGGSAAAPVRGLSVERLVSDEVNCHLAARHLAKLRRMCGNWPAALSLYHGGNTKCSQKPTEYSKKVMGYWRQATQPRRS